MASASGIRAGRAFIEVGVNDITGRGLSGIQSKLGRFQKNIGNVGAKALGGGLALAAPLAAGVAAFAPFEQALANAKAGANLTGDQLKKLQDRALEVSKATGLGATGIAGMMGDLVKAGVSAEAAMGDVGETAAKFSKVGNLSGEETVSALVGALTQFSKQGLTAGMAADTLSAAADASKASIQSIAQGMGNVGPIASQLGISFQDAAASLAVLDQAGVSGAEGGTHLKTVLLRLSTGADSAGAAMEKIGLSAYDAAGNFKGIPAIVEELSAKLDGLDDAAKNEAMSELFGSYGVVGANALLAAGGIDTMKGEMGKGMNVSDKFATIMDTTTGRMEALQSAVGRLGIAVGSIVAGPLGKAINTTIGVLNATAALAAKYPILTTSLAIGSAALITFGGALMGVKIAAGVLSSSLSVVSVAVKLLVATVTGGVALLLTPVGAITAALGLGVAAWFRYTEGGQAAWAALSSGLSAAYGTIKETIGGVMAALAAGDLSKAGRIAMLGLRIAFAEGTLALSDIWTNLQSSLLRTWATTTATIKGMWNAAIGELAAAQVGAFIDDPEQLDRARKAVAAADTFEKTAKERETAGDAQGAADARRRRTEALAVAHKESPEAMRAAAAEMTHRMTVDRQGQIDAEEKKRLDAIDAAGAASKASRREGIAKSKDELAKLLAEAPAEKKGAEAKTEKKDDESQTEKKGDSKKGDKKKEKPEGEVGEQMARGFAHGSFSTTSGGLPAQFVPLTTPIDPAMMDTLRKAEAGSSYARSTIGADGRNAPAVAVTETAPIDLSTLETSSGKQVALLEELIDAVKDNGTVFA
jgi:TP901 family phage tail tape measure protein